ncbi:MAG: AAA family ATPase, partial [Anaerolineae bacterium]|nr:AAA family ATPase [Anaerolineae bacterium]
MHIKKIEITNIRNIETLVWELPDGQDLAGWHVLIGDNGSGKTTVLRAIALGLIGSHNMLVLREDWKSWFREKEHDLEINLNLVYDATYDNHMKSFSNRSYIKLLGEKTSGSIFESISTDTRDIENQKTQFFSS